MSEGSHEVAIEDLAMWLARSDRSNDLRQHAAFRANAERYWRQFADEAWKGRWRALAASLLGVERLSFREQLAQARERRTSAALGPTTVEQAPPSTEPMLADAEVQLDSPSFTPPALTAFAERKFVRKNRRMGRIRLLNATPERRLSAP